MKLEVQFDPAYGFDQPIRWEVQTPTAAVASQPGIVAHGGNRRTAKADQARIDLDIFLGES